LVVLGIVTVGVVVVGAVGVVVVSGVVVDGGLDEVLPDDDGVGVELTPPPPPPHAARKMNGRTLAHERAWISLIRIHNAPSTKTLERSMPMAAKESLNGPETGAVKD
jgi:hypothetical protein